MKKIFTAALAALTMASPLAATSAYADPPARQDNNWNGRDNQNNRRDSNDRNDNRGDRTDRNDNRNDGRRDDNRQTQRWNGQQHNGYFYNGRFNYGPPPWSVMHRADFRPGYQNWRRGDRLPSYYRSNYRQVDYRRAHLRAPPRGYQYVQDNRGEYLLVGIATGVILSVILNGR